jgi:plasmid stabilization system protein ParE
MGLPTSVGSVLSLPRELTEREWERLVGELRTTFDTTGEVTSQGSMREWSQGSLHAFVEPTQTGYRLRITDSFAAPLGVATVFGGLFLALGLLVTVVLLAREDAGLKFLVGTFMSAGGGGAMALTALLAPKWARTQEQRMEHISRFTAALLAVPTTDG